MKETLPEKGILEKLTRKGKNFAFYITVNKAETLKSHNLKTPNNVQ
jgi:hypothetical protein